LAAAPETDGAVPMVQVPSRGGASFRVPPGWPRPSGCSGVPETPGLWTTPPLQPCG